MRHQCKQRKKWESYTNRAWAKYELRMDQERSCNAGAPITIDSTITHMTISELNITSLHAALGQKGTLFSFKIFLIPGTVCFRVYQRPAFGGSDIPFLKTRYKMKSYKNKNDRGSNKNVIRIKPAEALAADSVSSQKQMLARYFPTKGTRPNC